MQKKYLLGLVSDLFFISRVQSVAANLGLETRWLENADALDKESAAIDTLRQHPPSIVLLDLNAALPWGPLLSAFKTDPQLAQVPWLAFGSHKATQLLKQARRDGVDRVVANSTFSKDLPALISGLLK